ncbi:MAG: hypothetical protein JNL72_01155 [Flavipsychrobacter sp.]|nr:hypothetical protein [Flavipsychrobacter sp.]
MFSTIPFTGRIRGVCVILLLLSLAPAAHAQRPEPVQTVNVLASVSGGISYTGINTYVTLAGAFRRHMIYVGPKAVLSRSFLPGRTLWGANIGYNFAIIDQDRWVTWLNVDYQHTAYRVPAQIKYNSIQELSGGLSLNYFAVPQRLAIGVTLGTGIYFENSYNRYTATTATNSGLMHQLRLGLIYKLTRS